MATLKPVDMASFEALPPEQFVFELPGIGMEAALAKFQGRRSTRTISAASRLAAKPKKVRLPRNLLRKLWRATGGWSHLSPGWGDYTKGDRMVAIGDLTAYAVGWDSYNKAWTALLVEYRGQPVAHAKDYYNQSPWKDKERAGLFWQGAKTV